MSLNKKILITGSNGLLGQSLINILGDTYDLFGCDLTKASFNKDSRLKEYFQVNLTHRDEVQRLLASVRPDIIINAAACNNVDQCETKQDFCWDVNVRVVELIIEKVGDLRPIFVQIS